jgi:CubicO group peptidase (beta-lactamase class C family)
MAAPPRPGCSRFVAAAANGARAVRDQSGTRTSSRTALSLNHAHRMRLLARAKSTLSAAVAQLLAMSSGIGGDIFGTSATAHSLRTIPDYLRQFVNDPLDFEPGTKRAYSNAGYVVLGALVERVSGEEYRRYLQQHVFAPGRMTHTGFLDSDSLPPWAAIGYTSGDPAVHGGPLQANTPMLPGRGSPAAGSYSTVGDLLRYVHAQRTGAIAGTSGTPKVGRAVPLAPTPSSSRTCPGTTP